MIRRFSLAAATAMTVIVGSPAYAQHVLNFREADIRAFIQDAARVTGRTFIVDQRVQGKVSVVSDRPLSKSEYFEIVMSTLRANGLIAVRTASGAYRVQPADGAATQPSRIGLRGASRNQMVTEIFRLRSIDAVSAVETLRPLVSREGSITANKTANSVVVADYADNMVRVRELLRRIDRPAPSSSQIVTLTNAGAQEIAGALKGMAEGVSIAPLDSSNAIALRGDPVQVERLAAMARQLDQRAASGTEIRVYWLQHADAAKLLPMLLTLIGQSGGGGGEQVPLTSAPSASALSGNASGGNEGGGNTAAGRPMAAVSAGGASGGGITKRGGVVVTRYEGANAIIVAGNKDIQRMLGEVVRQLDTRRPQVHVEALVAEISDNAAKKLGVQFMLGGKDMPFLATSYSNANPNMLAVGGAYLARELNRTTTTVNGNTTVIQTTNPLSDSLTQAAADSLLGATGGLGGVLYQLGKNGIFGAIINAIKSDTESNLLSTPSIMTLDNMPAEMLVGQEVPVTTGEALSKNFDNAFRTVQRQKVGIQLEVTPQINQSGEVKLYIRQEVSSVAGPVSSRNSDLIINKREFKTTLTADNGEIVVIGGLLDDNERRTLERIPLLSDIPLIGELFKSRSRSRTKTNLVVFIRPTIVRDKADADEITKRRYGYIRERQMAYYANQEPTIDEIVRDYMGAIPPIPDEQRAGDYVVGPQGAPAVQPVVPPPVPEPRPGINPPARPYGAAAQPDRQALAGLNPPPPPPGSEAILPQLIQSQARNPQE